MVTTRLTHELRSCSSRAIAVALCPADMKHHALRGFSQGSLIIGAPFCAQAVPHPLPL